MNLGRRVRELEQTAREKAPPAPPPVEWRSEDERLRRVLELFALGTLRLKQDGESSVKELVPMSAVESLSTEELLSILGFKSLAAFARAEERLRAEYEQRPKLSREDERRRVTESLRARRGDS
ncbi:MAG TPA: hypothetical protein VGP08_02275 [Pyrinomonadaceae bacterium]|jgi:hypothetical protein|nr:hypothetical protein [Pyrinomonadaceae bacterium]